MRYYYAIILLAPIEYVGEFPSGQRGQTVNLLLSASVVRIHPLPPKQKPTFLGRFFVLVERVTR